MVAKNLEFCFHLCR